MPFDTILTKSQRPAEGEPLGLAANERATGTGIGLDAGWSAKRLFDVGLSGALLIFLAPLMLLAGLAVRFTDGGPAFELDERIGLRGRHFSLWRFRTHQLDDDTGEWATWTEERPGFTAVGSLLYATRVDQLPLLLNVLRGEISFVGPTPERPRTVNALIRHLANYEHRHRVRPGLTGHAQLRCPVSGTMTEADTKLACDLYYVANHSFVGDIGILARTLLRQMHTGR